MENDTKKNPPSSRSDQDFGKASPLEGFSQGQTFAIGAVGGFLLLCTVGFFVLLTMFLNGSSATFARNNVTNKEYIGAEAGNEAQGTDIRVLAVDEKVDHILGAKNPKVTIIEYSDLECPYCKSFYPITEQIVDIYGKDVALVFRHFPLTSLHPDAFKLANATECAAEQGKFWEMLGTVFAGEGGGADATLRAYASKVGINVDKFMDCVTSQKYADKVDRDANDAIAAGGGGTPYSVIVGPNGETEALSGALPFENVEAAIQKYL